MNKKIILLLLLLPMFLGSCSLFIDKDSTAHVSMISYKPKITLLGDPIMSLKVGSTYTEPGIEAYAGDTLLDYSIVTHDQDPNALGTGTPNTNQIGFYIVTYKAVNGFGWTSYAYRSVLVHDGTPYEGDISGNYKMGFKFTSTISKYSVNGYYQMDNVYQREGVTLPIIFADKGDGVNFGIVPGYDNKLGFYYGTAKKDGENITFNMTFKSPNGIQQNLAFKWEKY